MEIVFSSTAQRARAIRTGELSAVAVLDAPLSQIEKDNSSLNVIVTMDMDQAHQRAMEADTVLRHGEAWGPLHGVHFTLKDAFATVGLHTTNGFPPLDHVPHDNSKVAARLKAAGGIFMGKTNVATLLADYQTNNPIFGRTNNTWNLECTQGGSSGGAAVAVAGGLTSFDIGTDLSGSIRITAHFCGMFGLKPIERRISLEGLMPGLGAPRSVRIMSTIGPLARSIEDLELLFAILAGPDGRDTEVPHVFVGVAYTLEPGDLRIAFAPTFPGIPVAAEIREALESLAVGLAHLGAEVEEAALPALDYQQELTRAGELVGMMVGAFKPESQERPTRLVAYLETIHRRDQSIVAWEQFFDEWDALLCPPSMVAAFPHCEPGSPLLVKGREVSYCMVSAHAALFNYSGHSAVVMP